MSIKDWKNGRQFNLRDPDIKDMFAIDYPLGEQDDEIETIRNRNKINQAR